MLIVAHCFGKSSADEAIRDSVTRLSAILGETSVGRPPLALHSRMCPPLFRIEGGKHQQDAPYRSVLVTVRAAADGTLDGVSQLL